MGFFELFLVAVGLSMDAFAVAICKGLSVKRMQLHHSVITGLYFGGFQMFMPLLGYFLGIQFQSLIETVDHWIAFVLLGLIGFNMIKEALDCEETMDDSFQPRAMIPLAIATSIDALAVGVTFAFLQVEIIPAISFIGIVTFLLSAIGVRIGNIFGLKYRARAEMFGGIVLILMGLKILLEHLNIIHMG